MKKIIPLLLCILFFACSVQKRRYQKGYYIGWKKHEAILTHNKSNHSQPVLIVNAEKLKLAQSSNLNAEPKAVYASNKLVSKPINKTKALRKQLQTNDSCDIIVFRNGDEVSAKVLEISPEAVKYKKCKSPEGPQYVAKKSDIRMIRFANGTEDKFENNSYDPYSKYYEKRSNYPRETPQSAIASLTLGITGFIFFLGSIPAIILGIVSIKKIKKEPEKYTGEGLAWTGIGLGIAKLLLLVLIIMLSILL